MKKVLTQREVVELFMSLEDDFARFGLTLSAGRESFVASNDKESTSHNTFVTLDTIHEAKAFLDGMVTAQKLAEPERKRK